MSTVDQEIPPYTLALRYVCTLPWLYYLTVIREVLKCISCRIQAVTQVYGYLRNN